MTVRTGREFLAIPGPSTVPEAVLNAAHRPAIDIYSGTLIGITDSCLADLRRVFRTEGHPLPCRRGDRTPRRTPDR